MEIKTVKFNASMKSDLLEKIDETADDLGMTRSGFISMCCTSYFDTLAAKKTIKAWDNALSEAWTEGDPDNLTEAEKQIVQILHGIASLVN